MKMKDKTTSKNNVYQDYYCNFYKENDNIYSEKVAKKLLIKSVSMMKNLGTSTCTIIILDKSTGKVYTSYIGDSSYLILRYNNSDGKYYKEFKSVEQMHDEHFNTPYQVGKEGDNPEVSITQTHQLINNDIVILATDGYFLY